MYSIDEFTERVRGLDVTQVRMTDHKSLPGHVRISQSEKGLSTVSIDGWLESAYEEKYEDHSGDHDLRYVADLETDIMEDEEDEC